MPQIHLTSPQYAPGTTKEAKRVNDERLQIAEVVHSFAQIIDLNAAGG
jgi:hypothetical protein